MPCRMFVREPSSDKRSLLAPFPERPCILFLDGFAGVLLAIAISQVLMFFIPSLPASIPVWAVIAGLTVPLPSACCSASGPHARHHAWIQMNA